MIHLAGQATKTQFTVATQRAGREGNQIALSDGAARVVCLAQLVKPSEPPPLGGYAGVAGRPPSEGISGPSTPTSQKVVQMSQDNASSR